MIERAPVLVRGVGDVGSAVAVVLFRAGYAVALHDEPAPATPRRGMAFADAIFDGWATLDGLTAVLVKTLTELRHALKTGDVVPVAPTPIAEVIEATAWSAVIDARMRKRAVPERQRGMAPLTIGLGPNFVAGETVDLAIETMWGERLGAIVEAGATLPLGGEPRPIGGVGRARFVYAPAAGRFKTSAHIGDRVEESAVVATIGDVPVHAPIGGVLRGLTRSGVEVAERTKVIEVDPRCDPAAAFGLGDLILRLTCPHEQALRSNNRAENSHQAVRRRERKMQRFKSAGSAQRLLSMHAAVHNTFNLQRISSHGRRSGSFEPRRRTIGKTPLLQHDRRPRFIPVSPKAT